MHCANPRGGLRHRRHRWVRDLWRHDLDVILQRRGRKQTTTTQALSTHATQQTCNKCQWLCEIAGLAHSLWALYTASRHIIANHLRRHCFTSWGFNCRSEGRRRRSAKERADLKLQLGLHPPRTDGNKIHPRQRRNVKAKRRKFVDHEPRNVREAPLRIFKKAQLASGMLMLNLQDRCTD